MNIFQFIKNSLSVLQVIQEYINLKQAGIYWKGCCPFHAEKTPSFTVSPHRDIFYCFGCHAGGDVIAFIAKIENCSQLEAAKILIDRYNLKIPSTLEQEFKLAETNIDEKHRYLKLCSLLATWFYQQLQKSEEAKQYIKTRGLHDSTVQLFLLGYFPSGSKPLKSLLAHLQEKGFMLQDLIEAHIILEGKNGLYSPFEERIVFPIKNHAGEFCGFGGRIFKSHDERPKYYNSKENPFFNKGSLIFGLDLAKKSFQKESAAFLVEGYMDCLLMVQHGFTNTIATLGTSCTQEHLKLLTRFVDQLYVLYDGDNAGQQAVLRLTELAWNANLELTVVCLPQGEDPASFLEHGGNLTALVQNAQDIYSFFIATSGTSYTTQRLGDKLQTVKKLTALIARLQDPLKQSILLQEVAQALTIPLETLKREFHSQATVLSKPFIEEEEEERIPEKELLLLGAILQKPDRLTEEINQLWPYCSEKIQKIVELVHNVKQEKQSLMMILEKASQGQQQLIMSALLMFEEQTVASFDEVVAYFQKKHWKKLVQILKRQLAQAEQEQDNVKMQTVLHQFEQLKQKMTTEGIDD